MAEVQISASEATQLYHAAFEAFRLLLRLRDRDVVADAPEIRELGGILQLIREGRNYGEGTGRVAPDALERLRQS